MPVYTPHNIHFTRNNVKKIASGGCISIGKGHLTGEHRVFLTKPQEAKLIRAREQGTGFPLNFSPRQLNHHIKHGGGFWDKLKSIGNKVIDVVKPHLGKVIDKVGDLAHKHGSALIGKAAGHLGKHIGHGNAAKLADMAQGALHKGVSHGKDYANHKVASHGKGLHMGGKVKRRRKKKGGAVQGWPVRQGA